MWKSTSELGYYGDNVRVDGVGRPKFDFHTGPPKAGLPAHRLYRPNLVEGIE